MADNKDGLLDCLMCGGSGKRFSEIEGLSAACEVCGGCGTQPQVGLAGLKDSIRVVLENAKH